MAQVSMESAGRLRVAAGIREASVLSILALRQRLWSSNAWPTRILIFLLPADLRLACFKFPGTISRINAVEISALPENWIHDEDTTRGMGGRWWRECSSPLLIVPSAILPEESNYVLNPQHPDAKWLRLIRERPFTFDPRLI